MKRLRILRVNCLLTCLSYCYVKVYIAFGGFEESIGLDPNDPLIPVVLILGVSVVFWYKFSRFFVHLCGINVLGFKT